MSLTKTERLALERLRRYVVLERAALDAPERAGAMGYWKLPKEPTSRPLAESQPDQSALDRDPFGSNAWTNDVAASLKVYTESWVLPIIDALLDESGRDGKRTWETSSYLRQVTR